MHYAICIAKCFHVLISWACHCLKGVGTQGAQHAQCKRVVMISSELCNSKFCNIWLMGLSSKTRAQNQPKWKQPPLGKNPLGLLYLHVANMALERSSSNELSLFVMKLKFDWNISSAYSLSLPLSNCQKLDKINTKLCQTKELKATKICHELFPLLERVIQQGHWVALITCNMSAIM